MGNVASATDSGVGSVLSGAGSSTGSSSGTGSSSSTSDLPEAKKPSTDASTASGTNSTSSTTGTAGTAAGGSSSTGSSGQSGNSYTLVGAYKLLTAEVEEEEEEYEAAKEKAETAQKNAESSINAARNRLELLQIQLKQAQTALTTETETARETKNTAQAEGTAAQTTYETQLNTIQNNLDTLKDTMESAQEKLEEFESTIGDGYIYTSTAGTIMMVDLKAGDTLSSGTMVAAYTDTETITVNAAVEQSYIAQLSVGDSCSVVFEDEGTYTGKITSINPQTQSNSRTSVSYSVIVTLEGDVSGLKENTKATVYFNEKSAEDTENADSGESAEQQAEQ